jgi:SAM-dependent methyltransferase
VRHYLGRHARSGIGDGEQDVLSRRHVLKRRVFLVEMGVPGLAFLPRTIRPKGRMADQESRALGMQNRLLDHYRHQTIASARELVLEVGVGSGVNLPLYGPAVTRVVGLDPSPELLRLASRRAGDVVIPVSLLRASAEDLPVADAVFDTIVMTWTLCSIPNPIAALTDMREFSGRAGD